MLDLLSSIQLKDLLSLLFQLYDFLHTTQINLIFALYLTHYKEEAPGVNLCFLNLQFLFF